MRVRASVALLSRYVLIAVVCVILAGCGGALALLAPYLAIKQWDDWFGGGSNENPADYKVYVDGYEIGTLADASGLVNLSGVTPRDYLISVARPPGYTRGLQALIAVAAGGSVDLRQENVFEGGAISGNVRRDTTTGVPMPAVRVMAIREGAAALAAAAAPLEVPPSATSSLDIMMGYTNDAGTYTLGPALYGNWLVFATVAGYALDAKYVSVSSGRNGTANLVLVQDAAATTGLVTGSVTRGGGLIDSPILTAILETPYEPQISAETRAAVAAASGQTLPAGAWFSYATLTTIGPGTRDYSLTLPTGTHNIEAYAYNYVAQTASVAVTTGGGNVQDFVLPHR